MKQMRVSDEVHAMLRERCVGGLTMDRVLKSLLTDGGEAPAMSPIERQLSVIYGALEAMDKKIDGMYQPATEDSPNGEDLPF